MYCIMRMEKRKKQDISGLQREATRTATEYNNLVTPGMDVYNQELVHSDDWLTDIQHEIDVAGAKARSNSVVGLDTIYTASKDFFKLHDHQTIDRYFQDCLSFHRHRYGHIVSAIVHYDEQTPHMHVLSVPLTRDGRLSAREIVGGRAQMAHTQDAFFEAVGQQYGLERGDDITITGAKHKSTETYRRELAEECRTLSNEVGMKKTLLSGLNSSITKVETKIKALQTMVSNLEKAEADKQATIVELEDYMKNHLGDAVEIKAKITATRKELWDVRDKLNDKKMKLAQAKLQLDELQKNTSHIEARNREIKADFEKTAVSYQQQMINKIWAQAGMKALAEIADIYPRMTSIHDSSLFDDSFAMDFINYGDKIIYCAMYLYVGYINEATNFAESQGGGGSDIKDWGREKDEDEIEWIRRCLRQATKMMKPMKRKGLSR